MRAIKIIFIILLTIFSSCAKKSASPKNRDPKINLVEPAKLPAVQKHYQFQENLCETGSHNFYETKSDELLLAYCSALLDESANRNCARNLRHLQYKQDCSAIMDSMGFMLDESGEIIPQPRYEGLKNIFAAELLLVNLWVDEIKTPFEDETLLKTEYIIETQDLLAALTQCGQQFSGPTCAAYLSHIRLASGLLEVNGQQVYYYLAQYSQHRHQFLLTYPVQRRGIEAYFNKAEIYIVPEDVKKLVVTKDYASNPDLIYAGTTFFTRLTKERALALMKASEDSAQIVHLASWLLSNTLFDNEKIAAHQDILAIFNSKNENLEKVPAPSVLQYLQVLKDVLNPEDYEAALIDIVEGKAGEKKNPLKSKTLIGAAAAYLLLNHPEGSKYPAQLLYALSSEYPPATLLALKALQASKPTEPTDPSQPNPDPNELDANTITKLVKLFSHYDPQVAEEAFLTLQAYKPTSNLVPSLQMYFDGKNELAKKFAFLTIASIGGLDDPATTSLLLEAIQKIKDPVIKEEMMQVLTTRQFSDTEVDALVMTAKTSSSTYSRLQAIDWLFSIKSLAASDQLIDLMTEDLSGFRYYIADRLPELQLDDASFDRLRDLLIFDKAVDIEDDLVHGIVASAADFNQTNLSFAMRENGLRDIFERLRSEDETKRAFVLDELRRVSLPGKQVVKIINEHLGSQAGAIFYNSKINPFPDVIQVLPEIVGNIDGYEGTMILARNLKRTDNNIGKLCLESLKNRFERLGSIEPLAAIDLASNITLDDQALSLVMVDFLGKSNSVESNIQLVSKVDLADSTVVAQIMTYLKLPGRTLSIYNAFSLKTMLLKPNLPDHDIKSRLMDLLLNIDVQDASNSAILEVLSMPDHEDLRQRAFATIRTRKISDNLANIIGEQLLKPYDNRDLKEWLVETLIPIGSSDATRGIILGLGIPYPALVSVLFENLKQREILNNDQTIGAFGRLLEQPLRQDILNFSIDTLIAFNVYNANTKLVLGLNSNDLKVSTKIIQTLIERPIFLDPKTTTQLTQSLGDFAKQISRTDIDPGIRNALIGILENAPIPQAHETLITLLSNPDADLRSQLLTILKTLDLSVVWGQDTYDVHGTKSISYSTMSGALGGQIKNSPYPEVREFCLEVISTIEFNDAMKILIDLYFGDSPSQFFTDLSYRESVLASLKKQIAYLSFLYLPQIEKQGFTSPYIDVRRTAFELITVLDTSSSPPTSNGALASLTKFLGFEKDPEIRQLIVEYLDKNILNKNTGMTMIKNLIALLLNSDRDIRYQAVIYLGLLNHQCIQCTANMLGSLEAALKNAKNQETDPEILALLEKLLPTANPQ